MDNFKEKVHASLQKMDVQTYMGFNMLNLTIGEFRTFVKEQKAATKNLIDFLILFDRLARGTYTKRIFGYTVLCFGIPYVAPYLFGVTTFVFYIFFYPILFYHFIFPTMREYASIALFLSPAVKHFVYMNGVFESAAQLLIDNGVPDDTKLSEIPLYREKCLEIKSAHRILELFFYSLNPNGDSKEKNKEV